MEAHEISERLKRINGLAYGSERTEMAEVLVAGIDASGPPDALPPALVALVQAYSFDDDSVHALGAFSRLLQLLDHSPELFTPDTEHLTYWAYKWIAADVLDQPEVSADQIEALLADMEHRYQVAGLGMAPVRQARYRWAAHRGLTEAPALLEAWLAEPSGSEDDCAACVIGQQTAAALELGRPQEALRIAATQTGSCNQEPWNTRMAEALAAWRAGDDVRAASAYHAAMALEDSLRGGQRGLRYRIELMASSGHLDEVFELMHEWEHNRQGELPLAEIEMLISCLRAIRLSGDDELEAWILPGYEEDARALAERFDARNHTSHFTELIDQALALQPCHRVLDLEADARALMDQAVNVARAAERSGESVWQEAERYRSGDQLREAAAAFRTSAELARRRGEQDRYGLALAQAATCLAEAGRPVVAGELFAQAARVLDEAETGLDERVRVAGAWLESMSLFGRDRGEELIEWIDRMTQEARELVNLELALRGESESSALDLIAADGGAQVDEDHPVLARARLFVLTARYHLADGAIARSAEWIGILEAMASHGREVLEVAGREKEAASAMWLQAQVLWAGWMTWGRGGALEGADAVAARCVELCEEVAECYTALGERDQSAQVMEHRRRLLDAVDRERRAAQMRRQWPEDFLSLSEEERKEVVSRMVDQAIAEVRRSQE